MADQKPTYFELLRHPNWQRKRLEILSRANFSCEECGNKEMTLEVHHTYYEKGLLPWDYPSQSLHCLCRKCHAQAQDVMKLLHRQLGKIDDIRLIETVYGFAMGIEAVKTPDAPLDVFTWFIAQGLAMYFELDYDEVCDAIDHGDGVIDGAKLIRMQQAMWKRRKEGQD